MHHMRHKKQRKFRLAPFMTKLGGLVTAEAIRAWMSTVDCRAGFYDRSVDPVMGVTTPRIYVFWHEYILAPLYLRGHCQLTMLLSQHSDANVLARVAYHLGFDCVRGSTFRGGAQALWELFRLSQGRHITITPDGPRGPRRQMAQGAIYLASRLQMPLVAMGFGYDRPWRARSWDRFAIPRPFSRVRAIVGPPMLLPPGLDRMGIERCRQRVERLLNDLTCEAEAWAAAGSRKAGARPRPPRMPTNASTVTSGRHAGRRSAARSAARCD